MKWPFECLLFFFFCIVFYFNVWVWAFNTIFHPLEKKIIIFSPFFLTKTLLYKIYINVRHVEREKKKLGTSITTNWTKDISFKIIHRRDSRRSIFLKIFFSRTRLISRCVSHFSAQSFLEPYLDYNHFIIKNGFR